MLGDAIRCSLAPPSAPSSSACRCSLPRTVSSVAPSGGTMCASRADRHRLVALAALMTAAACAHGAAPNADWSVTGGDPGNSRYSVLEQINRGNVGRLRVAWTYHTGDVRPG